LLPEARNYRIHHLATHLILDDRHPDLSRIVFSQLDRRQRPVDGFLRLHEIYNLDLPSDLVVLSACKSGLGFLMNGEGMIGFTRGMLLAGAKAVLASVWSVDDEATAELMKNFYHELLQNRQPPSAALRLAQLKMMRQAKWRNPYYWAGFSLYGDWRP
jgi:CHAT domain-containing protein